MKKIFPLILIVAFLFLNCSKGEDPLELQDNSGIVENPLTISYIADNNLSGSDVISPASGGVVEASGPYGVHFTLNVPPGAVQQNLTITITPLSELDISGTGASSCDCAIGDTACCLRGAIFAPGGLVFDTTAIFVVSFPIDKPFPFEKGGSIIYFNSLGNIYELLPTVVDTASRTLACSISHLSGYGSDNPDELRLQALFDYYTALAQANLGTTGFYTWMAQLENLYLTCQADGYSALAASIADVCNSLFSSHAGILIANASSTPSQASIGDLITCISALDRASSILADYAVLLGETKSGVLEAIDSSARSLAEQAHGLCEQGTCSEGQALLQYVLSIASRYIEDSTFYNQVSSWLEDCCAVIDVSISASRSVLHSGILDPIDALNMYSTITVTVSKHSGDPLDGYSVDLTGIDPTGYPSTRWQKNYSGATDSEGKWQHRIYYSDMGDTYQGCTGSLQTIWTANVTYKDKNYISSGLSIIFQRAIITVHFDYSYEYHTDYPQQNAIFSAQGSGSGPGISSMLPCNESCDGKITREYSVSYFADSSLYWSHKLIDHKEIPGCIASPVFENITLPNGDRAKKLSYIYVNDHRVLKDMTLENCGHSSGVSGCDTTNTNLPTCQNFQCPVWPPTSDGTDDQDALRMFPSETGSFVPFLWDSTLSDVMSAEMTVTVAIEL